jgi:hypothetical protein
MLHGSISQDDNEDTDGKVNLQRFAFVASRPSMSDSSSRPDLSGKRSNTVEPSSDAPPQKKAVSKHPFFADFSNAGLAKLTKCVSCDIQWTTRKTAAQKINHIQTCAKKHSFNDETIRFLIRQEIGSTVGNVGKAADKKAKGKASVLPVESPTPKTFYEHVVTDAAPRKKARRVETGESVKSVATTRNAILDRARVVLESVVPQYPTEVGISSPAYMSTTRTSNTGNGDFSISSTQPFGKSALAKKHRTDTCFIFGDSPMSPSRSGEQGDALPATQAFAPSKFRSAIRQSREPSKPREDEVPSYHESQSSSDDAQINPTNVCFS